ncbi:MAG: acyl-CoA thioesterase [Lysobacteraceae bacterium]|nr:MAG: acyl-CoA thioesterase [Xanthomonadaceae bacterium]
MSSFSHTGRVTFHETDASGRFHYSNALIWAENAEHALYRAIGAGAAVPNMPRRVVNATFHRSFVAGDDYVVELFVKKIGNTSFGYSWKLFGDGQLSAEGAATVVHVGDNGRPASLPDILRAGLEQQRDTDPSTI